MKRAKSLFDQIVSFENLRIAWLKARRGKTSKTVVRKFACDVNKNLQEIQQKMQKSPPDFSSYFQFKINDPKERIISVVPFPDRVIHHAIINVLEPIFERQMIFHTYACRKGKGTHAAARYAFSLAKKSDWFLKLDVRKYFDSVNHSVLKMQLCRIIKDARCLELLFAVIDSYHSGISGKDGCALPIGNLTSQFFANLYLSSLDHFILEKLKPVGYVRYMDDMVIFASSLTELKSAFSAVMEFCRTQLCLLLKPPSFGRCSCGLPFLGWRIMPSRICLLQKTRRRMNRTLNRISGDFLTFRISEEKAAARMRCVYSCRRIVKKR